MKPCLICCATFNRIEMTQRCFSSLFDTANPDLYSLFIIDNCSTDGTIDYLKTLSHPCLEDIIFNSENLGTARALNMGWKLAESRGQHAGKVDNDVVWYDDDWLDKMVSVFQQAEDVGLIGLKRRDLEEKPNHNDEFFRSRLFTLPNGQVIEIVNHVMGTCWLVSNKLLKEIGALKQIGLYGLDDSIYCHRAHLAGYATVFVPDVAIDHIDPGHPKYPEYTQWKIDKATEVMKSGAYDQIMEEYRVGQRPLYEAFE